MRAESEKYNKVLNILKKSTPGINSTGDIERIVIERISRVQQSKLNLSTVIDFLFGWIYIGWVRRILIAASVVLIVVFVWQQGIILKQISYLSNQTIIFEGKSVITPSDEIEKILTIYKNSGRRFPSKTITISEKQMKELLKSMHDLQIKYKDLENLIEEDPELKKYIEKKLIENNHSKIKL